MYFFITDFFEPNIKLDHNDNNQQAITPYFFYKIRKNFKFVARIQLHLLVFWYYYYNNDPYLLLIYLKLKHLFNKIALSNRSLLLGENQLKRHL